MMNSYHWEDIDLAALTCERDLNSISIQLSSNNDGSDIALITCDGIISVRIHSALALNASSLPVFLGKVTICQHEGVKMESVLKSADYGFRFADDQIVPKGLNEVFRVWLEGGEIEAEIIALLCRVVLRES